MCEKPHTRVTNVSVFEGDLKVKTGLQKIIKQNLIKHHSKSIFAKNFTALLK